MTMKVRELIEHLAQFDGEMEVMILDDGSAFSEGLRELSTIELDMDEFHNPSEPYAAQIAVIK